MRTINAYLLREVLGPLIGATAIALLALLLERMLRLIDLTVNSDSSILLVFKMVVNLIPHYLGIALPLAFFLAVLLAFNRLSQDSELAVLHAAGIGLSRLLAPVMGMAILFTLLTGLIFGYLQPYGRYAHRALVYAVSHASLTSALKEGAFVHTDGMVFMADEVSHDGRRLSRVFVYEDKARGGSVTTTGRHGALSESKEDLRPRLYLEDGLRVSVEPGADTADVLRFDELQWPIGEADLASAYRTRGRDEEELTLPELWAARDHPPEGAKKEAVVTEFHTRIVRTLSILFLPLLAIPLGLAGNRAHRSYGIAIGVVILVVYHKVLELGDVLSRTGYLSPWLGLWLPLAMLALGSGYLFFRTGFTIARDPLTLLVERLEETARALRETALRPKRQK